jgi:hypothetical protein
MLIYFVIAIVMFALGYVAALIKTNSTMTRVVNSSLKEADRIKKVAHKEGWDMALNDRSMIASKYHEYYPDKK